MSTELKNPIGDILRVPELKKRIFFTLGIIAAYRVGATIPVPGVNAEALKAFFAYQQQQNTLLSFLNVFSGGALGHLAIFAMGVGPYINASIIISLLQGAHVIPYLDRLAKEGEQGRKRMNQITRYLTLALGGLQSFGLALVDFEVHGAGRPAAGTGSDSRLDCADGAHIDGGLGFYYVAGGAGHRTRHRKRRVHYYFVRHRRSAAVGDWRPGQRSACGVHDVFLRRCSFWPWWL